MTEALLHLVRHAEPAYATDGEDASAELTPRGVAQAEALGARLGRSGVDVVLHGPLPRATRTAKVLAAAAGDAPVAMSAHLDDRTPLPADDTDVPAAYRRFVDRARRDGGDEVDLDGSVVQEAVRAFGAGSLDTTLAACLGAPVAVRSGPLHVVLVTHAFVVGWFARAALDAPDWRWMGLNPSHASLTTLLVRDGAPTTLLGFDDLAHLPPALRSGVAVPRP